MIIEGELNEIKLGCDTISNQYIQRLGTGKYCWEYFFTILFMFLYQRGTFTFWESKHLGWGLAARKFYFLGKWNVRAASILYITLAGKYSIWGWNQLVLENRQPGHKCDCALCTYLVKKKLLKFVCAYHRCEHWHEYSDECTLYSLDYNRKHDSESDSDSE